MDNQCIINAREQLLLEIANDLIEKFDIETSQEILEIINKHTLNYEIVKKGTSLIILDKKSEKILKMYIGTKRLEGRSEKTLKQYYREIRLLLAFLNCSIEEVTTNDVKMYLMTMKTERNLQNSTVENMRSYLNTVFEWIFQSKYINSNPVTPIASIKIPKKVRKSFSDEEIDKMRQYCILNNKKRNLAIIDLLYSTGCRVSEVCALNISDIDFDNKEIIVLGKGNKERKVYLNDNACHSLKEYLKERTDEYECLFLGQRKNRLTASGIEKALIVIGEKTKIENVHPHRFRRTLTTNLLDRGMAIQDVSKILGHADIGTTQSYYYQTDIKVKKEFNKYI